MKSKIRLFVGENCDICKMVKQKISYEKNLFIIDIIDAFNSDNDEICDKYNVDELPHIQYIDEKENIIEEYVGFDVLIDLKRKCGR